MKYYIMVQFTITDTKWISKYTKEATKLLENWGGKYLARTNRIEAVEGNIELNTFVVLTEWPSKEKAESFYNSQEYSSYRKDRISGTNGILLLFPGEDITNESELYCK
ncbi:DUF1330 domain-containing protein [Yeosuana marina]|uniref:DUF1330 domain-containing protein n=1 Tax=Yeosuana marina TaxID=1565536 RepID=UPI0030C80000